MDNNLNEGVLGDLYKSALQIPGQVIKAPYTLHKSRYGKNTVDDEYTGSYLQKLRLKKVLNLMHQGKNLSPNDIISSLNRKKSLCNSVQNARVHTGAYYID